MEYLPLLMLIYLGIQHFQSNNPQLLAFIVLAIFLLLFPVPTMIVIILFELFG